MQYGKEMKKAWRNPRIRYPGLAVAVILVIIVVFFARRQEHAVNVWTQVTRGTLTTDTVESGEVRAVEAEYVRAPREWRMDLQIIDLVPEGTMVNKGDFLVQFDISVLEEELTGDLEVLKQSEADLKSLDTEQASRKSELETRLQIASHSLEAAQLNVEMMRYEARARQEEAEIDLKKAQINYEEAQMNIETQKIKDATERQKVVNRLEQAKAEVEETRREIEDLTLTAPISGMVVYQEIGGRGPDNPRYKVTVGDVVPSGEAIISIPDLSRMKLTVNVNELDGDKVKAGQKVFIRMDAFEGEVFHGVVQEIATLIEKDTDNWRRQPKAPSFEVNILIEERSELLKPGMTAEARIIIDEIPDVVMAPVGAIFEEQDGDTIVFPRATYPNPVPVALGERNNRFVIIERGVGPDIDIALSPPPETQANALGWFAEMERRREELREMVAHIETMNELGITNDPARADSLRKKLQPPDLLENNNGDIPSTSGRNNGERREASIEIN